MGKERAKRDTAGINSSLWPTAWKARSQFRDLASMKKRFRIVAEENRSRFSRKKRKEALQSGRRIARNRILVEPRRRKSRSLAENRL